MGHIGLTPQSVHKMGGYMVQGRDEETAQQAARGRGRARAGRLLRAGARGRAAGAGAGRSPQRLAIPTIGIGAGPHCDGQVLVCYDLLGLNPDFKPKFVKRYANLYEGVTGAAQAFFARGARGQLPRRGALVPLQRPCGWSRSNPDVVQTEPQEKSGRVRRAGVSRGRLSGDCARVAHSVSGSSSSKPDPRPRSCSPGPSSPRAAPRKALDAGFALADAGSPDDAGSSTPARPTRAPGRRTTAPSVRRGGSTRRRCSPTTAAPSSAPALRSSRGPRDQRVERGRPVARSGSRCAAPTAAAFPREVRIDANRLPVPPPGTDVRVRFVRARRRWLRGSALVTSPDGTLWLAASNGFVAPVAGRAVRRRSELEGPPFSCAVSSFLTCGTGFVATLSFPGATAEASTGPVAQGASAAVRRSRRRRHAAPRRRELVLDVLRRLRRLAGLRLGRHARALSFAAAQVVRILTAQSLLS